MGRIGPTEIIILLIVFVAIPILCYRLGYRAGRTRGERDEMRRREKKM